MKYLTRICSLLVLVSAGIFITGCGGDDGEEKSAEEKRFDELKGTWALTAESFNGTDADRFPATTTLNVSGEFSQGGKYTFTLSPGSSVVASPWPKSVSWQFGNPYTSQITRLDAETPVNSGPNVNMGYSVSGNILTVTFAYTGTGFAFSRTESVEGGWELQFTKQ